VTVRALIVVPTLNEAAHIEEVVNGLLAGVPRAAGFNLVISDGGSTDGTVALAERLALENPAVTLLHNPARIQSAGINLAVQRFGQGFDVLIRCDAHALYPQGFCTKLLQTLVRTNADAVVVPLDSVGEGEVQQAVAWVCNSPAGTGGAAHRGGRVSGFVDHGHHAAFRMEMFRRCGGYDETFTHNEDAEFDCRQRALGAKVYLDTDIRVGYRPRASFASLEQQYFNYGLGRSRTARRHPGSLRLRQIALPLHLLVSVFALAASPWTTVLLLWPGAYLALLGVATLRLVIQHRSPVALLTGPAALVMHTAWACGFLSGIVQGHERRWRPEMAAPLRLASSSGDGT
jgi:succinoglycan biosynthesis protein ExoA